jgi:hypothetical protein
MSISLQEMVGSKTMAKESKESSVKSEGPSPVLHKVLRPTHFDVIFGRGRPFQRHPGNLRMRRITAVHKTHYLASKRDKLLIADMILQRIKNGGSEPVRFLKRGDDGELWVEAGDHEAREKVRLALRFTKTKNLEPSDEVPEQETDTASLPVNQPSLLEVIAPLTVSSSNIPRQSLESLPNEALLSAPVLPEVARSSINPAFLPAAVLPLSPSLRMHGSLSHTVGVILATGYPLPPRMSGIPFGMVGAPVIVAPPSRRHLFGAATPPVGLLTDAQILEMLIQRRQGRAYARGGPQFCCR